MSKSNLEISQAETDNSVNSMDTLEYEEPNEAKTIKNRRANILSLVYSVVMAIITGLLLRSHSKHWKRWTTAMGVAFFALVKSSLRQKDDN
jgi:predicted membrane channel-forming protein YqfA (hemolysin III family)